MKSCSEMRAAAYGGGPHRCFSGSVHHLGLIYPARITGHNVAVECVPGGDQSFVPPDVGEVGVGRERRIPRDPLEADRVIETGRRSGPGPELHCAKICAGESPGRHLFGEGDVGYQ